MAKANGIDTTKWKYTLLVDGNNLLKISLVDKKMNSDGKEYGAVVTFLRILGSILLKKDFNYCIVAWDGEGSGVLRWKYYKDYKANRGKNYEAHDPSKTDYDKRMEAFARHVISYSREKGVKADSSSESDEETFEREKLIIQNILEELCIRQYEYENVEGDDIIAYYVKNKQADEKVVIASADKDLAQLISDTVIVYNHRLRDFVTKDNCLEKLGVRHDNIVVEKILCGDASDNIKGVKGIGEATLHKLFPQIMAEKVDLKAVVALSRELLDRRKAEKKKPLRSLENIVNGVTDGCQGDKLYEVNEKIIDLSEPMLTEDARKDLDEVTYAPMDVSDRDLKNIYKIIQENKIEDLSREDRFSAEFAPFSRIIMMERRRASGECV